MTVADRPCRTCARLRRWIAPAHEALRCVGHRRGCARRRPCSPGPRPRGGQALPRARPEKTLGVKLTSEERERCAAPLRRHARRQPDRDFTGTTLRRDLRAAARREGARASGVVGGRLHRPDRRERGRSPSPGARPSIPRTLRAIPATPSQSCAASSVVTLPIVAARASRAVKLRVLERRGAAGLLGLRRRAGAQAARPVAAGDLGRGRPRRRAFPAATRRRGRWTVPDADRRPGQVREQAARPLQPRRGRALPALPADLRRRLQRGGPPVPRQRRPARAASRARTSTAR